ncbi:helix-turn-helix domain-containing protein [Streptomyces sp. B1866]|uniref:TetR/AcrR family transcriptional regulator n=1 Tax=Streptomyces sp. B1866 TaxID=3075431 RepID=UPI0028922AD4|nr:helix-turn-helix domain-containing protein [Streptomyces sp. B1866]MDT3397267.1 helix-turn-helix domain-containing protein [Streptomyces sp. B1866]
MSESSVPSARQAFAKVGQRLPSRHGLSREEVAASQRARLLIGFLEVTAEKGYAAVTIGDIVERAGTSREAFYRQFAGKQECFLAAFREGAEVALSQVSAPLEEVPYTEWRTGLRVSMRAYLALMAAYPAATWTFMIEGLAAGPEVAALYGRRSERIAELYRLTYHRVVRREDPSRPELPDDTFDILVGGMADRVRHCLYTLGAEAIPELEPVFLTTILALFGEKLD